MSGEGLDGGRGQYKNLKVKKKREKRSISILNRIYKKRTIGKREKKGGTKEAERGGRVST